MNILNEACFRVFWNLQHILTPQWVNRSIVTDYQNNTYNYSQNNMTIAV